MNAKVERAIYIGIILVLGIVLISFGKKEVELKKQLPLTAEELYKKLGNPKITLQIIDVRPYEASEEEEDEAEETDYYTGAHIPGAIPLPDCDESKAPEEALKQINPYLPTVIISKDGNPEIFRKCAQKFNIVQNLKGGILAWDEAGYPEDEGEYEPPKAGGGGGCL
ncbi:MAG: rhodanese-like domain-containing protein [Aquificota bacterium]|nr:MAG: rhodanese-like domain-containing protein [Aquificota bacterium]